jgi:accessory gene regulator B
MENVSVKLTEYILKKGIIKDEDYALYLYGIQTGLESILCIAASMIIACLTHSFMEYFIVLCVLMPIRSYTDGIHMKKFYSCFLCSVMVLTCGPIFVKLVSLPDAWGVIISLIVMLVLHALSYVTTGTRYDDKSVRFFARQRIKIFIITIIALLIFYKLGCTDYIELVMYALSFSLITVVLEIIKIKIYSKKHK